MLLVISLLKETFQVVTEGFDYIKEFENLGDLIAYALVGIC